MTSQTIEVSSKGEGTEHTLYIEMPANGRFDITIKTVDAISDVSIVAVWEDSQLPPIDEPEEPIDNGPIEVSCEEEAKIIFTETDRNADGVVDERELSNQGETGDLAFSEIDLNGDEEIEYREALQAFCSCSNELGMLLIQMPNDGVGISIEAFKELDLKNTFDLVTMDTNKDKYVSSEELAIGAIICTTTFDAFDADGDGVNDEDDAFPDDPKETLDTDGDGVGDNADLAPSVANDLIYGSIGLIGSVVFVVLLLVGLGFTRGNSDPLEANDWDEMKQQDLASQMLGMEAPLEQEEVADQAVVPDMMYAPQASVSEPSGFEATIGMQTATYPSMEAFSDLLQPLQQHIEPPSQQLMGMLDANGNEVLEYPAESGNQWTRSSPSEPWHQR